MAATVPSLTLRLQAGRKLTNAEIDGNFEKLRDFSNSLSATMGVVLRTDGTLKPNAISTSDVIKDGIITAAKLAFVIPSQEAEKNALTGYNGLLANADASAVNVECDECVLRHVTDGSVKAIYEASLSINITQSGAGGLDSGSASDGNWYYYYIIHNPTNSINAGILSLSSVTPTMPSGYVYRSRAIGAFYYTSSAFRKSRQIGDQCYFEAQEAFKDVIGDTDYHDLDIKAYAPDNAKSVFGYAFCDGTSGDFGDYLLLSIAGYYDGSKAIGLCGGMALPQTGYITATSNFEVPHLTVGKIYYKSATSTSEKQAIYITGFSL